MSRRSIRRNLLGYTSIMAAMNNMTITSAGVADRAVGACSFIHAESLRRAVAALSTPLKTRMTPVPITLQAHYNNDGTVRFSLEAQYTVARSLRTERAVLVGATDKQGNVSELTDSTASDRAMRRIVWGTKDAF